MTRTDTPKPFHFRAVAVACLGANLLSAAEAMTAPIVGAVRVGRPLAPGRCGLDSRGCGLGGSESGHGVVVMMVRVVDRGAPGQVRDVVSAFRTGAITNLECVYIVQCLIVAEL